MIRATLLTLLFFVSSVQAATVVVLQGNESPFGKRYFCGFSSSATEHLSAFQYDAKKSKAIFQQIQKLAPDIVFSIGEVAVKDLAERLRATPIIVSDFHAGDAAKRANVVLVESDLPIGAGLTLMTAIFPTKKTVGTIYNPKISQSSHDDLVEETGKLGLRLASLKVDSPQEVQAFISSFEGKIDMFYWLHDSTTSVEPALSEIYTFAERHGVPVISLDASHATKGALLSVSVDPFKLGEQAWKTAAAILKDGKIPQMPIGVQPGQLTVSISLKAASKFNIDANALSNFLQQGAKLGYSVRVEP
ncbi:MAG TPA: ABC transporter substrate binding protein [Bdellovibrionota bacterium]|nr:ABC transporter substrate binding protein [Bdellovibrionota bacterium]